MKKSLKPTVAALAPNPVALISTGDLENTDITTVAWTGIINSVPMMVYISLRETRLAYELIQKSGEFVINLPTENLVVEADLCGTKTGRELDKFKECKFTKLESKEINTPGIKECPINIECKVKEVKKLGSHYMFISEVVNITVDEGLVDENENILFEKANLISFAGKKYFAANKEVGYRGICLK